MASYIALDKDTVELTQDDGSKIYFSRSSDTIYAKVFQKYVADGNTVVTAPVALASLDDQLAALPVHNTLFSLISALTAKGLVSAADFPPDVAVLLKKADDILKGKKT